jgi:L-malate glycosyltransferase
MVMRILIISLGEHPAPGGVDTYIEMVKKALKMRGHDVDLLCYSNVNMLPLESLNRIKEYHNILNERLGNKVPKVLLDLELQKFAHKEMISYFDLASYDVFHSQSGIVSSVLKQVYPKKPLVGTIHSCLFTESLYEGWVQDYNQAELFRKYDYDAVNYPDKVIAVSSIQDKNMIPIPKEKHEIIYNAIDIEKFNPNQKKDKKIKIATSGLLVYRKGYDIFLEALLELKNYEKNYEVSIFGQGPEFQKLSIFSQKNNLPVTFNGYIERKRLITELSECDIFVQPSRVEPFGFSVTEAMASGCVPICSKVGGLLDQVIHLDNGLLFDYENSKQLGKEIAFLIENRELRIKMREKSLKIVKSKFSLEVFGKRLENLYSQII